MLGLQHASTGGGVVTDDARWRAARIAPDKTHHTLHGVPMYEARFDEVMKFHAPGLAPVRRGQEAWHVDVRGHAGYERRFVRTFGFYEGAAAVHATDGWHHIRPDGSDLYAARHVWCGNYQEERCPVRGTDGRYHHIDATGQPVYVQRWRYAGDFRDGIAVVQGEDGRSSHIDRRGRLLHGRWFLDLDVFHKGAARARDELGFMHVDEAGLPLYARRFAAVEPFYNGQARVERQDGGLEVIDPHGRTLVELRSALGSERSEPADANAGRFTPSRISSPLRVLLIGLPGAGKSVLASALERRFGLPHFGIDGFRLQHADGTVAGDFLARAHFLRRCGTEPRAVFEFSALGVYRFDTANALREHPAPLLTVWVDAPHALREARISQRGGRVPWPRHHLTETREQIEMKGYEVLRADHEREFWNQGPGWQAHRIDTSQTVEETTRALLHIVEDFLNAGSREPR